MKFKYLLALLFLLMSRSGFSQLAVADNQTAAQLAEMLTGEGVVVLNPVLNCATIANGVFKVTGTSNLGIDSGIVLSSGRVMTVGGLQGVNGPNVGSGPSQSNGFPGDVDLNNILNGLLSKDVCKLEFDFVPAGDSISFDYVFASTEYQGFSCSDFNDVFAFLISGPGFTGNYNMARVPGTNVPVCVNSTTNPTVNSPNSLPKCTNMGPGSPYSQYYVNNAGGGSITYRGFTTVFTASAKVSPCDTFHLKLAIGDGSQAGGDEILDSGVFLKAGSLSSSAIYVKTYGGGGLETPFTNTVRGCPPGVVRVSRTGSLSDSITIPLTIGGTALNGLDYTALPSSVTMLPGDSVANLYVHGIPMNPPVGPKSVVISVLSPYNCGDDEPKVLASDTIMIYDSIYVKIKIDDTAICVGNSVDLVVEADTVLEFLWTPSNTVSNPVGQNVTVTPNGPTLYKVSATLPVGGTGCLASTDVVRIDVKVKPTINLGPDLATCGDALQLNAATSPNNPDETFEWTPAVGLSNATIRNPMAVPPGDINYVVKVNPGAVGCDAYDTIHVRLLPDHITLVNNDTIVCEGAVIAFFVDGDTAFHYNWAPEQDVENPLVANTFLTARTSGYYTVTASFPGCVDMPDSVYVEVQPMPRVNIGDDKVICSYDTIQLYAAVAPAYGAYSYQWHPSRYVSDSTAQSPVFRSDSTVAALIATVRTPIGCEGSDTMIVIVNQGLFLMVDNTDTAVCPPAKLRLEAHGADRYAWSPSRDLDNASSARPWATPVASTDYWVNGEKDYGNNICYDSQLVRVQVYPQAFIDLPDSVQIWPGEQYQIEPGGNCYYFEWFPTSGLSNPNVANPLASPEVRTRYFVTASTEGGCVLKDSIDILVNLESVLEVPNGFVPTKGAFKVLKRGTANLKSFKVFNRWGNLVFETADIDKGWDGTYKGKEQPMGVYVYVIDAETNRGTPFQKTGNVTLVR